MSKVFVLERVQQDIEQAERFGEIEYVFDFGDLRPSIWKAKEFSESVIDALEIKRFDPERDLFAITGHIIPITLAMARMIKEYGRIRVLFFKLPDREYVEKELGI